MKPGYPDGHEFLTREVDDLVKELTGVEPEQVAHVERVLGFLHDGDQSDGVKAGEVADRTEGGEARVASPRGFEPLLPP